VARSSRLLSVATAEVQERVRWIEPLRKRGLAGRTRSAADGIKVGDAAAIHRVLFVAAD